MRLDTTRAALVAQLFSTLPLVGVIWLVQIVSYPLFADVSDASFIAYHATHVQLITVVVTPLMGVELVAASLSVARPATLFPRPLALGGLALVALAWATTMLLSVPQHEVLALGFDARAHVVLVDTNWLRTAAWTARAGMLAVVVARAFRRVRSVNGEHAA